jgi:hypothetical protein
MQSNAVLIAPPKMKDNARKKDVKGRIAFNEIP